MEEPIQIRREVVGRSNLKHKKMTAINSDQKNVNVCNLVYLKEMTRGKKHLIKDIIDVFLLQAPEELNSINIAVKNVDYESIKTYTHSMRSTVSVMGISSIASILQEMEAFAKKSLEIDKIIELNIKLNSICKQAIAEIEIEKQFNL